MCIYIDMCMYIYIYIYIYRERGIYALYLCCIVVALMYLLRAVSGSMYRTDPSPRLVRNNGRQGMVLIRRNSLQKQPTPCRPMPLLVQL